MKNGMRFAGIFSCLLILGNCTQDQESDRIGIMKADESFQTEALLDEYFVREKGTNSAEKIRNDVTQQSFSAGEFAVDHVELVIEQANIALQEKFTLADQDGDGYLELYELPDTEARWMNDTAYLENMLRQQRTAMSTRQPRYIADLLEARLDFEFEMADANGDNQVTREEYHNRYDQVRNWEKQRRLLKLDTNQDCLVDYLEYAVEIAELRLQDTNNDGVVSATERRHDPVVLIGRPPRVTERSNCH